ncbi:MAG: SurA N-terminal domain-containing protein, partial [Pseudomonadota bacterium]
MLQSLRKSVGSFVIKILFALLVLSFAVWGIGDTFFFGGNTNTVAEVGKREISVQALQDSFRNEMERLRRFNIDEEQARQLGVLDQVLERLIAVTLIEEAATDMGLVVGRSVIQGEIRKQLGQNVSSAELQARLRQAGISEAQYVDQLRRQVLNTEYQGSLATGAKAPKALVDRLYEWRGEKRTASFVTVPVDPASPVADPTDEQLKAYYEGHPGDFTAPEYRTISYVFLDTKAAAARTQVPENRLREIYEERLSQFVVPERRTVLQMLVPDQAAATKAMDKLRAGEDFAAVAKEIAGQDASATELGTVTQNELPDELADTVFGLAKDGFSEP